MTYTAEYAFGFDLGPDPYDPRATDKGIEVHVNPARLEATLAVTHLRHRVVSGGPFTDEEAAIIRLQEEAARRAQQQGQAMASEPAVTVVYRQPPKAASTAQ